MSAGNSESAVASSNDAAPSPEQTAGSPTAAVAVASGSSGDAEPTTFDSTTSSERSSSTAALPSATGAPAGIDTAQYGISRDHLEQEVTQVIGTLSSWWGGVKKQSASALTSLKADLDKTVIQAQADFEQLKTAKVEVVRKDAETFAAEQKAEKERKAERQAAQAAAGGSSDGDDAVGSILNRLTSSTTQFQNTLQSTYQSTLAAAANNPALANATDFTKHLADNIHLQSAKENIQLSLQQAEKLADEYVQRGEQLRKDAGKWVKDNVKVVPPAESGNSGSALSWDGSDWYAIATQSVSGISNSLNVVSSAAGSSARTPHPGRPVAGSRKDALLARLREDPELVLVDPQSEATPTEQRQRFERWLVEKWPRQREQAVGTEGPLAGTVRMATVPEQLSDEQFWQRYLYIRDTIIEEDERRQQLLKATEQTQADDFTWDDEADDDSAVKTPLLKQSNTLQSAEAATPIFQPVAADEKSKATPLVISAATSPRDSEESYDVVSDQTRRSDGGPIPEASGKASKAKTEIKGTKADDDEDSDWE